MTRADLVFQSLRLFCIIAKIISVKAALSDIKNSFVDSVKKNNSHLTSKNCLAIIFYF